MTPSTQNSHASYTVAILCAMNVERNAVRYMLDEEHPNLKTQSRDPNCYTLGKMQGHNVVLACLPGQQGKGAAATVATNMSRSFPSIKWRLFVGIGGGVPSDDHDIRLGDVVISMPEGKHGGVVQYDLGKQTSSGFEMKGDIRQPPTLLMNAAQKMQSDHIGQDNKIGEYLETMFKKWPRTAIYKKPSEADLLFRADSQHPPNAVICTRNGDVPSVIQRQPRLFEGPEIHYGLIASGDSVIKDAVARDDIVRRVGYPVLCFEMEAAGLMTEYEALVIRGISDYADAHKAQGWQCYASATAAACAKELLSYIDPEEAAEDEAAEAEAVEAEPADSPGPRVTGGMVFHGRGVQNSGNFSVGGNYSVR
ncbi:putative pfs domain-containing protein [Rosellinia necatrix]|uniref:Putative pfs domain-containing protein n=1 Tax=Rosellinia necatrix TaxID=77044 RepID=A0A1W2TWK7_ROSNE|nr:putative pfs domain-containing protein [Rosellinia necatrix]